MATRQVASKGEPEKDTDEAVTEVAVKPVAVLMAEVMAHVREVKKDGVNSFQKFNFRGIDQVMNAVGPALRKAGVVIVPTRIISHEIATAATSQSKSTNAVKVHVEYTAYGPAGDSISMEVVGEAQDTADKGTAKAMSVAYRTLLLQAFTLPTDDTDPDSEDAVPYTRGATMNQPRDGYADPARGPVTAPVWNQQAIRGGITNANGDVNALRAFYKEAESSGCPPQGLEMIKQAAVAAQAMYKPQPEPEKTHTLEDIKRAGAVATGADTWGGKVSDVPAALDPALEPDPNDDAAAAWLAQNS